MQITVSLDGVMKQYGDRIRKAGAQAPMLMANGLNAGGSALRVKTIAAETAQTGLAQRIIAKAQREYHATPANLAYEIEAKGGDIRLKFFRARETRAGVSAAPWNKREVFAGSFIKGGRFPKRVGLGMGGHVFKRAGSARMPIVSDRSGLFIPTELVTGQTAAAFNTGQASVLDTVTRAVGAAFGAD
jgi:hypothetical protein